MLEEQAFDPGRHDREAFASGVPELDTWLQRFATQQRRKGISTVFVLVDSAAPASILGYYSLSAAELDASVLGAAEQKKLPRYPVPCFRMGRLATSAAMRGKGLGRLLVACAVDRCLQARKQVAAYALVVDAKSVKAKAFYEHYGFKACADSEWTLYLPLGAGK